MPSVGGLLARVLGWLVGLLARLGVVVEGPGGQLPVDGQPATAPAAVDDPDVPPFAVAVRSPGRHSVDTVPPERAVYCLPATYAERRGVYADPPAPPPPDVDPVDVDGVLAPAAEAEPYCPPPITFEPYVDVLPPPNHTPLTVFDADLQAPQEPWAPHGLWLAAGGGYGGPGGPGLDRRPETLADLSALHTYPAALEAAA